jgi:hypothetical protein
VAKNSLKQPQSLKKWYIGHFLLKMKKSLSTAKTATENHSETDSKSFAKAIRIHLANGSANQHG